MFSACGKIGPPEAPIPRAPLVVDELSVAQEGARLILSFPIIRTARSTRLQRIDIYRLIESESDPLGITQESFTTRAIVIGTIPQEDIPLASAVITYTDDFNIKNGVRNSRYRYAVRLVTASGTAAALSNLATITPLLDLALPPNDLRTRQMETGIEITWSAPTANENGTTPANILAYNIYRRASDTDQELIKLNTEPLTASRYIDRNFQFGSKYDYVVRGLSALPDNTSVNNAVEGNLSKLARHTAIDTFPPSAPSPVQIASIGGIVSLFWPTNPEPDVTGYNIYRTENENAPAEEWIKLNLQLHKPSSIRDDKVQVNKRYYYRITAVDSFGNESARSEKISEVVAP
ncbi:MAG: hypothetical protein L0220_06025 [Acidobacteria bacterium]|nr:hypothetical protein [Acidobacteriota bacterium]